MESILIDVLLLLVGILTGLLTALLGMGGGSVILPALLVYNRFYYGQDLLTQSIATTLLAMAASFLFSTLYHRRSIDWQLLKQALPYLIVGVLIGNFALQILPDHWIFTLLIIVILLQFLRGSKTAAFWVDALRNSRFNFFGGLMPLVLFVPLAIVCGIGGGFFIVPYMHSFYGLSTKSAIRFSVTTGLCLTTFSTLLFIFLPYLGVVESSEQGGYINWSASALIMIGLPLGCFVGKKIHHGASEEVVKVLFRLVLMIILLFYIIRLSPF